MRVIPRRDPGQHSAAHAFTLIELVAVIVVLAILAGIAIPKYIDYSTNAKVSATKGILGGVRSAIANFYANSAVSSSAVNGTPVYPTLVQLQTDGTVLAEAVVPANPYNNSSTISAASWTSLAPTSGTNGWNYDASNGRFWANSNVVGENLY